MSILSLPNELLLQIATFLDTEKDISAFLRTNQHLRNLLLPYLYQRNIECSRSISIWYCARNGNRQGLELLLRRKQAPISRVKDHDGNSAARHLPNDEIDNIVTLLIEIGSRSVTQLGSLGSSYLLPSSIPRLVTFEWLLDELEKFLFIAAEKGYAGVVEALCMHGVGITYWAYWYGYFPIHAAAAQGHEDAVKVLLDNGAEVDDVARDDCYTQIGTPLYLAACFGHVGVVELLIRAGADVNNAACEGQETPLHGAVSKRRSLKSMQRTDREGVIKILLSSGASLHALDSEGRTPLELARSQSQHDAVELLLAHAAKCGDTYM